MKVEIGPKMILAITGTDPITTVSDDVLLMMMLTGAVKILYNQ